MVTQFPSTATAPTLVIDYYFLDNQTCTRCRDSGAALDESIALAERALGPGKVRIERQDHHLENFADVVNWGIKASPTIRIAGHDIQPDIRFSTCADCGDLCACDGGIDCREWTYGGKTRTTAPVGLILEAILATVRQGSYNEPVVAPKGTSSELAKFFNQTDDAALAAVSASTPEEDPSDCGCEPTCCTDDETIYAT